MEEGETPERRTRRRGALRAKGASPGVGRTASIGGKTFSEREGVEIGGVAVVVGGCGDADQGDVGAMPRPPLSHFYLAFLSLCHGDFFSP
jgi:hypothetical protein